VSAASQAAEQQLIKLLARAQREQLSVSNAGAKHSMGGHTIAADGSVIDMLPFKAMRLSADGRVLTVQATCVDTLASRLADLLAPVSRSFGVLNAKQGAFSWS